MTDFYSLEAFFGSFFHQDWEEDYESAEGALERFLAVVDRSKYGRLVDEIDSALGKYASSEQVDEWINGTLHAELYPEAVGMPLREWLLVIRSELLSRITTSDPDSP